MKGNESLIFVKNSKGFRVAGTSCGSLQKKLEVRADKKLGVNWQMVLYGYDNSLKSVF